MVVFFSQVHAETRSQSFFFSCSYTVVSTTALIVSDSQCIFILKDFPEYLSLNPGLNEKCVLFNSFCYLMVGKSFFMFCLIKTSLRDTKPRSLGRVAEQAFMFTLSLYV